jgi:transcriptional regulator with XRE-family HTH domain
MDATRRRVELAAELRALRVAKGLTQQQVAAFLRCTQGKINKIETAQNDVKPKDLNRLLEVYGPTDDQLARINRLRVLPEPGLTSTGRGPLGAYVRMVGEESQASVVLAMHSERIPRPLQSDHYRLKQCHLIGDTTPQATLLFDRDDRATIFTDPDRTSLYRVLLSESALHRMPGGRTPGLVIDQAQYLLDLMERHSRLSVQIVTFEADLPFLDADFTVLKFANGKKDIAYVDSHVDAQRISGTLRVTHREKYWHRVHQAALDHADTKKFLRNLIDHAHLRL